MGIHSTPYKIGKGQSPVDCKVYGNTQLGTDEASSPWFWIVGGLVVAMLIWAVVS